MKRIKVLGKNDEVLLFGVDEENRVSKVLVLLFPGIVGLKYQRESGNIWEMLVFDSYENCPINHRALKN